MLDTTKMSQSKKDIEAKVEELRKAILEECEKMIKTHEKKEFGDYNDHLRYSALVREMLDTKKMARSKLQLLLRNLQQRDGSNS